MGYWLAKGSYNPAFPFSLILKTNKKLHADKIKFSLDQLGLKYNLDKKSHSLYIAYKFEITDQNIRLQEWAKILGSDPNNLNPNTLKLISANALQLSQSELLGIWEGWSTAEGYKNNTTSYAETLKKDVADFMQLVALKLGYRCSIKTIHPTGKQTSFFGTHKNIKTDLYRLKVSTKAPIIRVTSKNWSKHEFKGNVYCITTSSGLFLGRTNGKVGVLGQCDALRYLISNLFGLGGKAVIAEQKIGPMNNPQTQQQYSQENWMSKRITELTTDAESADPANPVVTKGSFKIIF